MMMTKKDQKWHDNYQLLRAYVELHRQLPDKKKVDNRALLNWWKYNKKCIRQGKLSLDKVKLLEDLNQLRLVRQIVFAWKDPLTMG